MKLESRRERAERLKKQRRSTLAGMIIAIIVVGIICIDAVFKTINITIELDNSSLFLFSSCNDFIALIPSGVAAFPNPKKLATIFIDISLYALLSFFISGNINFIIGDKHLVILLINVVSLTISIIPFHIHIIPIKLNIISTVCLHESKIESLILFILKLKSA